jgi:hypothetical protein
MAMIALGSGAKLSVGDIQRDLKATWPDLPPAEKAEKKEGTFAFRIGQSDVIAGHMPAPIPWSDLEGPCATSWLWPDAASALKAHKTHLIVTVSGESGPLARAALLTQAMAAILAACKEALGVFWCPATLVISAPVFRDFAVRVLPLGPPLHIWVDFRVGRNEAGLSSGFTTGMASLGHMELETTNSPEPPGELRERMLGLAHYLIENGPVIRDGDTFGQDANERIRVVYAPSAFGHKERVMRLQYPSASSKPWWKVW